MPVTENFTPPPAPPDWRDHVIPALHGCFIVAFMALFACASGDFLKFASGDQGLQLAWMTWRQTPDVYAGDPIVIAFEDYHSLLLRGLSPFSQADSYIHLDRKLLIVSLAALLGMILWLSLVLFRDWLVAYWAVILAAVLPLPALAGSPIVNEQFVPSAVAIPLIAGALVCYFKGRWTPAGAFLGAATLLHPLEGGVAFAAIFLACAGAARGKKIKPAMLMLLVYAVISMPMIVIMAKTGAAAGGGREWIEVLRWRSPHHIFPLSWGVGTWGRFAVFAAAAGGCFFYWVRHTPDPEAARIKRQMTALAIAVGVMALAGVFFTEIAPWAPVLKAQPLRSANLLVIAAIPFLAGAAVMAARRVRPAEARPDERRAPRHNVTAHHKSAVFASLVILGAGIYWNLARNEDTFFHADWNRAQRWARENTRPGQRFLCLPPLENFRTLSRRPEFGSWKDGTLANFSPAYAIEWRRRMELLGMTWTPEFKGYRGAAALADLWAQPEAARVRRVLSAEPCEFIVARAAAPLPESADWKPVYHNAAVIIYEIQPPAPLASPANP